MSPPIRATIDDDLLVALDGHVHRSFLKHYQEQGHAPQDPCPSASQEDQHYQVALGFSVGRFAIINNYPDISGDQRAGLVAAVRAAEPAAAIAICTRVAAGDLKLSLVEPTPAVGPREMAAAAAFHQITWAWDESEIIQVLVDTTMYHTISRFVAGGWETLVWLASEEPPAWEDSPD